MDKNSKFIGELNVQKLYETLALIIGEREGLEIKVKVKKKELEKDGKTA